MPRRNTIGDHPKKKEIIQAIIERRSYRDISGQYGVSRSALSRYVRENLAEKIVDADKEDCVLDGQLIAESFHAAASALRKQLEAYDELLRDTEDPERYTLYPRPSEIDVVFRQGENGTEPKTRKRCSLQLLLDRIEREQGIEIEETHVERGDPRKLLLNTVDAINRQLNLFYKLRARVGELAFDKKERRRIVESEVWSDVQYLLADAVSDCPEAREKLLAGLEWLEKKHSSS